LNDSRRWYSEPQTFVAVAALVVSLSAVAVALYEASLQRAHDRADVWPHLEIGTFVTPTGADVFLTNGGVGPGIVKSVSVSVDDKPKRSWADAMLALRDSAPTTFSNTTVVDEAVRAGDRVTLLELQRKDLPPDFWKWIGRVGVRVCYSSVFDDSWQLIARLGASRTWQHVKSCPDQPRSIEF